MQKKMKEGKDGRREGGTEGRNKKGRREGEQDEGRKREGEAKGGKVENMRQLSV